MSKTAKVIISVVAMALGSAWMIGAMYLMGEAKPWAAWATAAYPWAALGAWWLVGTLSSAALTCAMEDKGVTWGALSICATFGAMLAPVGVALAALFGPLIASFVLNDTWFPSENKPAKEYPEGHWTKRVAFRCPGKPRHS